MCSGSQDISISYVAISALNPVALELKILALDLKTGFGAPCIWALDLKTGCGASDPRPEAPDPVFETPNLGFGIPNPGF